MLIEVEKPMYNLLIVDDESLVRRGIKAFVDFEQLQIGQVFEAENGEQALALFQEHDIQIVLADINMPKMNGLDFAIAIKAISKTVKIALITGYDYFDYAVAALKAGVDDYVLKPVSRKDITEVLAKLIEKHKLAQQAFSVNEVLEQIKDTDGIDETDTYQVQLKNIIETHISNPELSLVFIADEIGLSTGYLSGLFKKLFGLSFQDYVLKHRLDKAKLLLLSTDMKNYEIAEAIGFDDPNYFSTRFKMVFGCSPKQYKKNQEG